jgi:polar amino acid transport system substrate-binding protein
VINKDEESVMKESAKQSLFNLRRHALMCVISCLAVAASGSAVAQQTLESIQKKREVIIGTSGTYPPFSQVRGGQLMGFDIDLGNEIARRLKVKATWQTFDLPGIIPALTSKRIDVMINSMLKTPERALRMAFSDPYYEGGIVAGYRPELAISKPHDLKDKVIAVQIGSAGERYVRDNVASIVKEIKTYNDFPLALQDVELGRADAVVNILPVMKYNVGLRGNKVKVSPTWDNRGSCINVRLDDPELLAAINQILGQLRSEGFLQQLDKKWFGS